MDTDEKQSFEGEIYGKLRQAEQEELDGAKPYSLKEVWGMTEKAIDNLYSLDTLLTRELFK